MQPISALPLLIQHNEEALEVVQDLLRQLGSVKETPHVMDDATLNPVIDSYTRMTSESIPNLRKALVYWESQKPTASQKKDIEKARGQMKTLENRSIELVALAKELSKGTIDRVLGMSDVELGLQHLLGGLAKRR